jgi:hypothetical protein
MPRVAGFLRIIKRRGRPVDPGYGVEEGVDPGYGVDEGLTPDQGLPGWGGLPPYVSNRPPGSWTGRPSHPIARPPWERPAWPPGPTDPDWGVPEEGGGESAEQLPGEIPLEPDNTLPPVPEHPEIPTPPIALPPGSIWPPLPPEAPPGTHAFLIYISGVGHRYGVFTVPEKPVKPVRPDQGLPPGAAPKPVQR